MDPPVKPGAALPPPVTVRLSAEPIDAAAVRAAIRNPACGAEVVFEGVVRQDAGGPQLLHLDYEAYSEMAEEKMREVAVQVCAAWPIERLFIVHRVGRLEVGDTAVVVAVAGPHRSEAFEAARQAIDQVKAEVPIWKREVFADGTSRWGASDCHCGQRSRVADATDVQSA